MAMASLRRRGKVWYFRFVNADGVKREHKGCPDRRATEQMAAAMEADAARIRAGVVEAKDLAYAGAGRRPLADHLQDYHRHLLAQGVTAKHARLSGDRIRRVVALIKGASLAEIAPPRRSKKADRDRAAALMAGLLSAARLPDLTTSHVQRALSDIKESGLSLQSCNHHRAAIRAFARWAWEDGRLREAPLVGLKGFNVKEDRRHDRRTISVGELRRLITVAHDGPPYRRMSGHERAFCYRLAACTGLRYSEIGSLTPESFSLDEEIPSVTVRAAYTKNGENAVFDLPADLATDLRP